MMYTCNLDDLETVRSVSFANARAAGLIKPLPPGGLEEVARQAAAANKTKAKAAKPGPPPAAPRPGPGHTPPTPEGRAFRKFFGGG